MSFSENALVGIGLQVCIGTLIIAAVLILAVRALSSRRGRRQKIQNMWADPGENRPPAVDGVDFDLGDDFGGVPTTGSVQEYERDADGGDILGSSGFENRPRGFDDRQGPPPPDEH